MVKHRCQCRLIQFGSEPPAECPLCGAGADAFELCEDASGDLQEYRETQVSGDSWEATYFAAHATQADALGLPQVGHCLRGIASAEHRHASGFAELELPSERDRLLASLRRLIEAKKGGLKLKLEGASLAKVEGDVALEAWFRICSREELGHIRSLEWCLKQLQRP